MTFRPIVAVVSVAVLVAAACSPSQDTEQETTSAAPPPAKSSASPTAPEPRGPSVATPIVGRVIAAPVPVPATDGKVHLAYEIELTNTLAQEVTLTSVDVRAGNRTVLSLPGDRLAYWTRLLGNPAPTTKIGPAQTAVVWLDIVLGRDEAVPERLVHAVGISVPQPMPPLFPATMTEDVAPVTVQTRAPVSISPPLAGPSWLNAGSCCDMTSHRTALNPINGELWAAERYAIDYLQLGPDGMLFTGDKADVNRYPYFGADILAVGDGPVVTTLDGLPEQVPGVTPTGLTLEQYGGNHIVQDLGNGNYAFYAHIKTGAVRVKPGDRLTTGQVIGSVGNSGNSDAPHLHFHVMSTPDPLRSDGLPFVFPSYQLDSRISGDPDPLLDGAPAQLQPGFAPRTENGTSPLSWDVMTYDER